MFSQGPDEKRLPEVGSQNCSIFETTLISFDVPVNNIERTLYKIEISQTMRERHYIFVKNFLIKNFAGMGPSGLEQAQNQKLSHLLFPNDVL